MIKITLPIYYVHRYKTKRNRRQLVGMNAYRNWHYHVSNKIKTFYHELVEKKVDLRKKIKGNYKVKYKLYPKNARSDMMNMVSVVDKFLQDALQECGIIEDDNVKIYTQMQCEVVEIDKKNPRIECEVEEV